MPLKTRMHRAPFACLLLAGAALSACTTLQRLADVGAEPRLTGIENPTHQRGYKPVSLPMPAPISPHREPNSLWRAGSRAFFKDLRASRVGDLVTVKIDINDKGELENTSERTRNNLEGADAPALLARAIGPRDLLLTGGVEIAQPPPGVAAAEYNSLYVLGPGGRVLGRYDKAHLVP